MLLNTKLSILFSIFLFFILYLNITITRDHPSVIKSYDRKEIEKDPFFEDYYYEWKGVIDKTLKLNKTIHIWMNCDWPICKPFYDITSFPHVILPSPLENCPIPCEWTSTYNNKTDALVVIPDTTMQTVNLPFHPWDKEIYKILFDLEPSILKPLKDYTRYNFDGISSFREDDEIPCNVSPIEYNPNALYNTPPGINPLLRDKSILFMISHPSYYGSSPHRIELAKKLNDYYTVDSYGNGWRNKNLSENDPLKDPNWKSPYGLPDMSHWKLDIGLDPIFNKSCFRECRSEKIVLYTRYRYVFIAENNVEEREFWIRIWDAWYSGTIPIVYCTPGIEKWAPSLHSFINVWDFGLDMKKVSEYIHYLDSNDAAFNEYHQWRYQKKNKKFLTKIWKHSMDTINCRICLWTAKQKQSSIEPVMIWRDIKIKKY